MIARAMMTATNDRPLRPKHAVAPHRPKTTPPSAGPMTRARLNCIEFIATAFDMSNAVAMNSMQFNLARVIGPALGGVVFGLWGATACFGLNGLSFVAVIIALAIIKMPPLHADAMLLFSLFGGVIADRIERRK